jgi:hypothetical protein
MGIHRELKAPWGVQVPLLALRAAIEALNLRRHAECAYHYASTV